MRGKFVFRNLLLFLLLLPVLVPASAIDLAPFSYKDPRSLSLGGITVFGVPGIHTLHANPANFSQDDDVLYTLVSAVPHISLPPDLFFSLKDLSENEILEAGSSGLGQGMNIGMGLTGKGVGLGLLWGYESYSFGDASTIQGVIDSELSLVLGYAMEFRLGDFIFTGGGDFRPVFRVFGPYGSETALETGKLLGRPGKMMEVLAGLENPYYATGVGFDLGATAGWKGLGLGVTIRDAGDTIMAVSRPRDVGEAMDDMFSLSGFSLEEGASDTLTVPMRIDAGLMFSFEDYFFPGLRPDLYLEMGDLLHIGEGTGLLESLRGGINLDTSGPLSIRTGFNAGGFSSGLGLELPILDIDLSYYRLPAVDAAEEGRHGFALEGRVEF